MADQTKKYKRGELIGNGRFGSVYVFERVNDKKK